MSDVERYLEAATRANTRRSYEPAIRHFELEWGGHLPATADHVNRYLADYAEHLAILALPAPPPARRRSGRSICGHVAVS